MTLTASRTYLYSVARSCDAGHTNRKDCAAVLLFCTENAVKAAMNAMQILGKSFTKRKKKNNNKIYETRFCTKYKKIEIFQCLIKFN